MLTNFTQSKSIKSFRGLTVFKIKNCVKKCYLKNRFEHV